MDKLIEFGRKEGADFIPGTLPLIEIPYLLGINHLTLVILI